MHHAGKVRACIQLNPVAMSECLAGEGASYPVCLAMALGLREG